MPINLKKSTTFWNANGSENMPHSNVKDLQTLNENLNWYAQQVVNAKRDIEYWDVYRFDGSIDSKEDFDSKYAALPNNHALVVNVDIDKYQTGDVVIKDNNPSSTTYGYATLYMHLLNPSPLNVNDDVSIGEEVGTEGSTGTSTGLHLHVEMQNINRFNNQWHWSYNKSDYLDPTVFMGIDNIDDTSWIYDGSPYIPPTKKEKHKFPWVLYARKLRKKHIF